MFIFYIHEYLGFMQIFRNFAPKTNQIFILTNEKSSIFNVDCRHHISGTQRCRLST